ncbi:MAG: hypothetical protein FJX56_06895 [Alphaproteobacteria bacterium]|nr:hypothetical protein [Alphaproteobacteria bacterium]
MTEVVGVRPDVFVVFGIVFGGASYLMGQALAGTWRPWPLVAGYAVLLALGNRFLAWAMFDGPALLIGGFALALAICLVCGLAAYRLTWAEMMVRQYPWLYERAGLWSVRPPAPPT